MNTHTFRKQTHFPFLHPSYSLFLLHIHFDEAHLTMENNLSTESFLTLYILLFSSSCFLPASIFYLPLPLLPPPGEDSDSDSDLSMDEERSLSIPSSESEDNVRLRGRIQRRFKRSNHSERLLTEPAHNGTKGTLNDFQMVY